MQPQPHTDTLFIYFSKQLLQYRYLLVTCTAPDTIKHHSLLTLQALLEEELFTVHQGSTFCTPSPLSTPQRRRRLFHHVPIL